MPDHTFDIAVIGGGILGFSTAAQLAGRYPGLSVVVLEKERLIAAHQSGHNSGVIHSGLYYRPGSAKARLAVEGADRMLAFCHQHGIAHERCGKVVVATTEAQISALDQLEERGRANGVPDLRRLDATALQELEPHATGVAALHVPSTGIADYGAVTEKYRQILQSRDGEVRLQTKVDRITTTLDTVLLHTRSGKIHTRYAINCAGLFADRVAALAGTPLDVRIVPFRGEYYALAPRRQHLVRNLIYPVPNPTFPFLGVHFTRRVDGTVEAGPNAVLALRREGYRWRDINPGDVWDTLRFPGFPRLAARYWRTGLEEMLRSASKRAFVRALRALVPAIQADDLVRAGSGVRAQALDRTGALVDDFHISESERMIHVLNAPSPGATASLGIGGVIADRAAAWLGEPGSREDPEMG